MERQGLVEKKDIQQFRLASRLLICGIYEKVIKRSPLCKPVCRFLSYLTPDALMKKTADSIERNIKQALMKISSLHIVTANFADKILSELSEFLSITKKSTSILEHCRKFNRKETRLDDFYISILSVDKYKALYSFMKLVFCLSHGQSSVERLFFKP